MIKPTDLIRRRKTRKEVERGKRKAELGVCRIRKLPVDGKDCCTVGSGSVIRNALFDWPGYKDKYCLVTTDKVLPDKDFDVKGFVLDFRKLNRTLREFKLADYANRDAVFRFSSGLVVIPLDPKGFQVVKKPSIFTFRPFTREDDGYSENLVCPTVDDTDAKHFAVKAFRLEQMKDRGPNKYVVYDEHSSTSFSSLAEFIGTSSRKPHGAVILSDKECKAVGVLYCPHDQPSGIYPIWLSQENLKPSSAGSPEVVVEQPLVEPPEAANKPHLKEQPLLNEEVEVTSGTDKEDTTTLCKKPLKKSRRISESTSDPVEASSTESVSDNSVAVGDEESVDDGDHAGEDGGHGSDDAVDGNNDDFNALLRRIRHAAKQGFGNLKRECNLIKVPPLTEDMAEDIVFPNKVDRNSEQLMPVNLASKSRYVPLETTGDGNCFYRAASILAFGNENRHKEMRVRTVIELAVNSEFYLKDKGIMGRIEAQEKALHPGSEKPSPQIDPDLVKTVFENDVLQTARRSSRASYWHLQALGTVLNRVVQSVYPECGMSEVRKYFHAEIRPRQCDPEKKPLAIMWTHTTGGDPLNFIPNHFVPLIPADKVTSFRTKAEAQLGAQPGTQPGAQPGDDTLDGANQTEPNSGAGSEMSSVKHTEENKQVKSVFSENDNEIMKRGIQEIDLTVKKDHELDARKNQVTNTRLSTKVSDIPFNIYSQVCLKLNIRDEMFFKDFRLLGEKLGYSRDMTRNLGQRSLQANPTDELLRRWSDSDAQATVEKLIELLKKDDFKRTDVVEILEKCPQLSIKVTDVPFAIYSKVCLKLNIKDEMFYKDFRLLGEKLGYSRDVTRNLEQNSSRTNPTDELLQMWCKEDRQATVGRLIELLKEGDLKRMDVVQILEDWLSW